MKVKRNKIMKIKVKDIPEEWAAVFEFVGDDSAASEDCEFELIGIVRKDK